MTGLLRRLVFWTPFWIVAVPVLVLIAGLLFAAVLWQLGVRAA